MVLRSRRQRFPFSYLVQGLSSSIKNSVILLASLATLSTALPGFGQWHKPSGAPTDIAQGGHDGSGGPPSYGADAGAGHPSGFGKYPGAGADEDHDHPSGDDHAGDGDHEHGFDDNRPAAHSRRGEAAMYKAGNQAESKYEGTNGNHQAQHKNNGGASDGHTGHVAAPKGHPAEHRWYDGSKQSHPRDVHHEGPIAAPAHEEPEKNEIAKDIRFLHLKDGQGSGAVHTHQARAATRGMYECMNKNFVMPCTYTPVNDGQCYNRNYGDQDPWARTRA
ncbi:hypothetical protein A1O1_08882 [Capronia coronata CBS 617.96]|uniref:Uncharacterized protein n=1 Tax=Capronia coronata CBS 617.96 TaxID=1182541 RepID=W9XDD8_9EURO|nr:uncharacterized protein A1O1_08882 [Capronia coronata CBS 617.96]EXJ78482.1 hypothetical protein A1O1_08882 [Capronia coronata CBS 617.96]